MPGSALQAAVRRTGPAALFVWSQLPGTADHAVLEAMLPFFQTAWGNPSSAHPEWG